MLYIAGFSENDTAGYRSPKDTVKFDKITIQKVVKFIQLSGSSFDIQKMIFVRSENGVFNSCDDQGTGSLARL